MITAVIPARMASSRFPNKPLAPIAGLPMIEHVRRRAALADGIDEVVVATCDAEIRQVVESFGGKVVMTSDVHERGTDRVNEAMRSLRGDIIVMVQGDEPLIMPSEISRVSQPLAADPTLQTANLLSPLDSPAELASVDVVKAACDQRGNVIYYTRSPIPHYRNQLTVPVYKQTGIIAFRTVFLQAMSAMPLTPLEHAESVDMMRPLEHGIRVLGVLARYGTIGVDRPTDVSQVEVVLQRDADQREIFNQIIRV